jgi:hypothetical protein
MPIFPDAVRVCHAIRNAGAELWITTTRPYLSLDNIVPDTVEWLRRHEIIYDGMLFDEDKYAQLANRVDSSRVVAVLDDLPEMCEAASKILHYGTDAPILVAGQYNQSAKWPTKMSLADAGQTTIRRIENWEENRGWATNAF